MITLLDSRRHLAPAEQDILLYLLANLPATHDTELLVPAPELTRTSGRRYTREQLQSAITALGRWVLQQDTERGPNLFWLFQSCTFITGKGTMAIQLTILGLDYLRELNAQYTFNELRLLLGMTGKYARRLLRVLTPYLTGEEQTVTLPLAELREQLGLDNESKEVLRQIGHLREKVLNPSIRQLNELLSRKAAYDLVKEKGRCVSIRFTLTAG